MPGQVGHVPGFDSLSASEINILSKALKKVLFCFGEIMYKTKKFGVVSCKTENQILAELEHDLEHKKNKGKDRKR